MTFANCVTMVRRGVLKCEKMTKGVLKCEKMTKGVLKCDFMHLNLFHFNSLKY